MLVSLAFSSEGKGFDLEGIKKGIHTSTAPPPTPGGFLANMRVMGGSKWSPPSQGRIYWKVSWRICRWVAERLGQLRNQEEKKR